MINYEGLVKHLRTVDDGPFGLVSHQASAVAGMLSTQFPDRLACLFSPEHGWFGAAAPGEKTEGEPAHPYWGVPIISLYSASRKPSPEHLAGICRLVVDLQDLGVRCYTYLATLKLVLEAAAENDLPVTVLDRPVPLGGVLDGPRRELEYSSFVAPVDVPFCHGMTPGECARWMVREEKLDLDLTVMRMKNWSHSTRAPWPNFMPPSPGIRSWDSAVLYPATVFTEAYPSVDCDRAGPLAFRIISAPWLSISDTINDLATALPACGLGARPYRYLVNGQQRDGILLAIDNPDAFYPATAGVVILAALYSRYGDALLDGARPEWFDKLMGTASVREAIRADALSDLFSGWIESQDEFLSSRVDLYQRDT